jgi:putative ABC transport system permease protein
MEHAVSPTASTPQQSLNKRLAQWSWKEIVSGQLWPISAAIALIIACVFALSALAERMEQVIVKQGKDALTADLTFRSSNPIPEALQASAVELGLIQSQQVNYATMAFSDSDMQLVSVKAVESNYPLRGDLTLQGQDTTNSVQPNQLWLEPRIMSMLNVSIGDTVTIGDADFQVSGEIADEPGLNFNPFQQMPTVLIHYSDVEKTGAIQLGSRVRYVNFYEGDEQQLSSLKQSIEITPSDSWRDQGSASRTNEIFDRTTQYLSLTVAIVILMAATTLVLTCQHYVNGRRKTIAMLKSIGASKAWITRWLAIQVALLLSLGTVGGLIFGFGLEVLLRIPLVDLLPDPLPSYGIAPVAVAIITCVLIGVPALGIPLTNLVNTSAVNVLQPAAQQGNKAHWGLVLVPILPLLFVYASNTLVWIVLVAIGVLFVLLAAISVLLSKAIGKAKWGPAMALAISRLNRSSRASGLQFGALALSLMLLSIIWLVRSDLLGDWQRTLPANAPNAFAINIADYEVDQYIGQLDQQGIDRSKAFPIIRGRLAEINGLDAKQVADEKGDTDAVRRELNLTWSDGIPDYNVVRDGAWTMTNGVSVESEVADNLGLKIGDSLRFVINAQPIEATVNSIRIVDWREMKPNFYFIFTPDLMTDISSSYMVSFRVDDSDQDFVKDLSSNHPTVSLLDVRKMGEKIQELLGQIVWSITVLAALGVIAGLLLIFTLLRLSLSQRQLEIRLYRTLGASRKRIANTIWCEYGLMALIAGVVASFGAEIAVGSLMKFGFDLTPTLHVGLWVVLPILTFVILATVVNTLIKQLLLPVKNGSI